MMLLFVLGTFADSHRWNLVAAFATTVDGAYSSYTVTSREDMNWLASTTEYHVRRQLEALCINHGCVGYVHPFQYVISANN